MISESMLTMGVLAILYCLDARLEMFKSCAAPTATHQREGRGEQGEPVIMAHSFFLLQIFVSV